VYRTSSKSFVLKDKKNMSVYSLVSADKGVFNLPKEVQTIDVDTRNAYNATIVGMEAGANNQGQLNVFIGYRAGNFNISGGNNVYIGADTAERARTASENVIVGSRSAGFLSSGTRNVYLGNSVGYYLNGNNNILVGFNNTVASDLSLSHSNIGVGYNSSIFGHNNILLGNNSYMLSLSSIVIGEGIIDTTKNSILIGANIVNTGSNVLIINNRHNSNNTPISLSNSQNGYLNINDYIVVAKNTSNISQLTLKNDLIVLSASNVDLNLSGGHMQMGEVMEFTGKYATLVLDKSITMGFLKNINPNAPELYFTSNSVAMGGYDVNYTNIYGSNHFLYMNSNLIVLSNNDFRLQVSSNNTSIGGRNNKVFQLYGSNNVITMSNGGTYIESEVVIYRDTYLSNNLVVDKTSQFVDEVYVDDKMSFCNMTNRFLNWDNVNDVELQEFYGSSIIQKNLFVGGMMYSAGLNVSDRLVLLSGNGTNQWNQYVSISSNQNPYLVFQSDTGSVIKLGDDFTPELFNFTGKHRCSSEISYDSSNENSLLGKIVVTTGDYVNLENEHTISIDEAIPVIALASNVCDSRAFGVISGFETNNNKRVYRLGNLHFETKKLVDDVKVIVNSVGEGGIWVCNQNGSFKNGDLIVCSGLSGYGMKQQDDIIRSYTVAKITCDCDFEVDNISKDIWKPTIKKEGDFLTAFVGCVYKF
jgi:hypothetical protein